MSEEIEDFRSERIESKHGEVQANIYKFSADVPRGQAISMVAKAEGMAGGSAQIGEGQRRAVKAYDKFGAVAVPPVDPNTYVSLADEPTIHACIEAKVVNICQQGYKIRPRWELAVLDQSLAPMGDLYGTDASDVDPKEVQSQLEKAEAFLSLGMPDYPFPDMLASMWRDVETIGQGFIEFSRDANDDINGMYPCKAVTIRHLKDGSGYLQIRGGKRKFFAKYTADNNSRARSVKVRRLKQVLGSGRGNDCLIDVPVAWGTASAGIDKQFFGRAIEDEGDEAAEKVNELLCMKKDSAKDTVYGEPDTLSAAYDLFGARYAAQFNANYFENATVPRLAIIVRGGELSDKVVESIQQWMNEQNQIDALNQVLMIEVPGTDVEIDRWDLSVSQLNESGFNDFRVLCDERIMRAHRVPPSIIASLVGLNRAVSQEANWRFLSNVVRPEQRRIEARFNYIFREDLGIKDVVLDLAVPELISELERAEILSILMGRGVISINEVRRFYGRPPVKGGDEPLLNSLGVGFLPVSLVEEVVRMNVGVMPEGDEDGEGKPSPNVSSQLQTPPSSAPIFQLPNKGKALFNAMAVGQLQPEQQRDMALILEDLGLKKMTKFVPEAEKDGDDEELEML